MILGQAAREQGCQGPSRPGPPGAASLGEGHGHSPERPSLERPAWTHKRCALTLLEVLETWQGVRWAGRGFCPLFTRLVLWRVWEDAGQPTLGC